MLKFDDELLQELGLGELHAQAKNRTLQKMYTTLELRVGLRLAEGMGNEQLDEFEKYFDAKDDAGAFEWLQANFPNYQEIVAEEFEVLKHQMREHADCLLEAAA